MATTKKKASPAQIAARKRFAEMARSGAFKRAAKTGQKKSAARTKSSARARKAPSVKQFARAVACAIRKTKKKASVTKPPSPAQLAARAKFAAAARARSKATKAAKKNTALSPTRRHAKRQAAGHFEFGYRGSGNKGKRRIGLKSFESHKRLTGGVKGPRRKSARLPNPLRFKSEKEFADWKAKAGPAPKQRKAARKSTGGVKGTLKQLGRSITRGLGMAHNPRRKRQTRERRIVRAKRQQIVAFRQHGVRRAARRTGPGRLPNPLFDTGPSRRAFAGHLKRERKAGRRGMAKASLRQWKLQHAIPRKTRTKKTAHLFNPSPAAVFSEFRGKNAATKTRAQAAAGTPATLAKLGQLRELRLRGKKLSFGGSASLAASGRKKLYVVGVRMKRPNPPGEVDYGEILSVTYRADKPHVEQGTFDYVHKFGDDGGKRPHLIVDAEGYPKLEGGSYKIDADGIIN